MRTVIGVDAGGTNTRAVVVDESGRSLGLGLSGPGNATSAGVDIARTSVLNACVQAVAASDGAPPDLVVVSAAGMMGGQIPGLDEQFYDAGIEARPVFIGDTMSAYFAGTAELNGAVLIVGTGAAGGRIREGEIAATIDGLGWLLGDEGSGFWIGRRVVQAVCRELDHRGPATALTELVLDQMASAGESQTFVENNLERDPRLAAVMNYVYSRRPVELSTFSRLAFQASDDPIAVQIISDATEALCHTASCLIGDQHDGPLVLAGGVVASGIGDALTKTLPVQVLRAAEGTAGAALKALLMIGVDADESTRQRIVDSLDALRRI